MRLSRILLGFGWVIAIGAVAASLLLFDRLLDERKKGRLTSVQLSGQAQSVVPNGWAAAAHRVLLVGDSRVRHWTPLAATPDIAFATSGIGGETVGQLERRFESDIRAITPRPHEVIIASGVNDLVAVSLYARWGTEFQDGVIAEMMRRLEGLIDQAEAAGMTVRLATIIQAAEPDLLRRLTFWDDSLFRLIDQANGQLGELAARKGIEIVDLNAILDGAGGPLPARYAVDALHFSPAAYDALNAGLLQEYSAR